MPIERLFTYKIRGGPGKGRESERVEYGYPGTRVPGYPVLRGGTAQRQFLYPGQWQAAGRTFKWPSQSHSNRFCKRLGAEPTWVSLGLT
eukprot:2931571-Rhodomonas_salina.1